MVFRGYDAPQKKLYEKNAFWTNMCFLVNKVICLLSLHRTYGEKPIVENA
jgi:hypothetical protein